MAADPLATMSQTYVMLERVVNRVMATMVSGKVDDIDLDSYDRCINRFKASRRPKAEGCPPVEVKTPNRIDEEELVIVVRDKTQAKPFADELLLIFRDHTRLSRYRATSELRSLIASKRDWAKDMKYGASPYLEHYLEKPEAAFHISKILSTIDASQGYVIRESLDYSEIIFKLK